MLHQPYKQRLLASNVAVFDDTKKWVDLFEAPGASELVKEARVRRVIVLEPHPGVLVEVRESLFWVMELLQIGEEGNGFAGFRLRVLGSGTRSRFPGLGP